MRLLFLLIPFALASAQPKFEVASVKAIEHRSGQPYGPENVVAHPGSVSLRNVRLRAAIKWAYDLKEYQVVAPEFLGSPGWMAVDRYDIIAKAADGTPVPEMRAMLQALLAERFKLTVRRQEVDVAGYALVMVKAGPNLHQSATPDGRRAMDAKGPMITITGVTIADFAEFLAGPLHAPVVDETKLEGHYDLKLDSAPYAPAEPQDMEYSLTAAIREQLGMKLEKRKFRMPALVVDHVETKPAEN